MDALDIFPAAGIRFVPTVHEQGAAHMADGYARMSGKHGVCIAQNGPGVTNFVTAVAAAYWAHTPMLVITPETGSNSLGLGGFQETEQMPIFSKITRYQAHVNRPDRLAEMTARCLDLAMIERGPTQLNIPRDYFYGEFDARISPPQVIDRGAGGERSLDEAARLLANAKSPVDYLRRRSRVFARRRRGVQSARRKTARAGGEQLFAQRFLSGLASAMGRAFGLSRIESGDAAFDESRCRARARHAAWAFRHFAAARLGLLAEKRQVNPNRFRSSRFGIGEAGDGFDLRRRGWRRRKRCWRG